MTESGALKFQTERLAREVNPCVDLVELNSYRSELRALRFIGEGADGVGFGNISFKNMGAVAEFFITVSGSGGCESIGRGDLVLIKSWSFAENIVRFEGPGIPSAETMTHAAIYEADSSVGAVLHIHDAAIWHRLIARGESTVGVAEYGSAAMARAVQTFVKQPERLTNVLAMSGHEEGVLAFGRNLADAWTKLMAAAPGTSDK